jgi:hypothetical protein
MGDAGAWVPREAAVEWLIDRAVREFAVAVAHDQFATADAVLAEAFALRGLSLEAVDE